MKWKNDNLKLHIISVGHGDSILIEFPDRQVKSGRKAVFGLVDAGGTDIAVKDKTLNYLIKLLECRIESSDELVFPFACLTHPHEDHLLGLLPMLKYLYDYNSESPMPEEFWDCGFRHNTYSYLSILDFLTNHKEIQFTRLTSGTEFHFNDVEILVLAPSIDMRNRYDTFGVDLNNASIVLKITYGKSSIILSGDSEFDTWGKISEEFPKTKVMRYPDPNELGKKAGNLIQKNPLISALLSENLPLKCSLLKIAHHGSKNGTNYETIVKLNPNYMVITCDDDNWYKKFKPIWSGRFPHPITRLIIGEHNKHKLGFSNPMLYVPAMATLKKQDILATSHEKGSIIYNIHKSGKITHLSLGEGCRGQVANLCTQKELLAMYKQ